MNPRFEDRHRELVAAADTNADDRHGWDQWTTPADSRLATFYERTGPLVDDLVAGVRDLMKSPIDGPPFIEKVLRLLPRLEALDEASR